MEGGDKKMYFCLTLIYICILQKQLLKKKLNLATLPTTDDAKYHYFRV